MEILTKMASGFRDVVDAAGADPDKAARLMIVDKLKSLAQVQASAIANIGFEKVVVYDSGNGNSVGNFLGGLTRPAPVPRSGENGRHRTAGVPGRTGGTSRQGAWRGRGCKRWQRRGFRASAQRRRQSTTGVLGATP